MQSPQSYSKGTKTNGVSLEMNEDVKNSKLRKKRVKQELGDENGKEMQKKPDGWEAKMLYLSYFLSNFPSVLERPMQFSLLP